MSEKENKNLTKWKQKYDLLREFIQINKRFPKRSTTSSYPDETSVGLWCQRQRSLYRQNKLPPEISKRLEGIPGWAWGTK